MMHLVKRSLLAAALAGVAACGGGGEDEAAAAGGGGAGAGGSGGGGGAGAGLGGAAGEAGVSPAREGPDPWKDVVPLARLVDKNPDPGTVEVDLEAAPAEWTYAPGKTVHGMAYNGSFPGPLLEANVGDKVIVHFKNSLSEQTSIHWHGVRVPNEMDGVDKSIQPGESFDYVFEVLDAGTFWYHPHFNESGQMDHGLKGPILVHGPGEPQVDAEGVMLLDDILVDDSGQIAPFLGPAEIMLGREGNVRLVNGKSEPTIPIRAGSTQRWRIINTSGARFWRLSLEGHELLQIGGDGGLLNSGVWRSEMMLVPGERADVLVTGTGAPSSQAVMKTLAYNRGHGGGTTEPEQLLTLAYAPDAPLDKLPAPTKLGSVEALPTEGANQRTIKLSEGEGPDGTPIFMINDKSGADVPPIDTKLGALELWDVYNDSPMDHPFHLHGFFFQVIESDGKPEPMPAWKDTVNVRTKTHLKLVLRPELHPGMWMYHCHILQHVDHGMMGHLDVSE